MRTSELYRDHINYFDRSRPDESRIVDMEILLSKKPDECPRREGYGRYSDHELAIHFIIEHILSLKANYYVVDHNYDLEYSYDPISQELKIFVTLRVAKKTKDDKYVECLEHLLNI
ncbi:MAG: hypothetical protein WC756_17775 [Taibaiella sp.]|jgi:hypothetical protein